MSYQHKSGAKKRTAKKQAAESLSNVLAKMPKLTEIYNPQRAEVVPQDDPTDVAPQETGDELQHAPDAAQPGPSSALSDDAQDTGTLEHSTGDLVGAEPDPSVGGPQVPPETELTSLSNDPALWPERISDSERIELVKRGPIQVTIDFPFTEDETRGGKKRKFLGTHYSRRLPNGEQVKRSWMVYSTSKDAIFCFCCRLFGGTDVPLRRGLRNWEKLTKQLHDHEIGSSHLSCYSKCYELRTNLRAGATIDARERELVRREQEHWKQVFTRLVDVVIFLAERNLAFRGTTERLGSPDNGNFLGVTELLAKFDPVLNEHCRRIRESSSMSSHYMSNMSQNELIELVASGIHKDHSTRIKSSKYYSVILDCTPDVSHTEQMSFVIRIVEMEPGEQVQIRQFFMGFEAVSDTTGKGLYESLLALLTKWDISVGDCRGQCYDNGANMKGKEKGVQARLLEQNPMAFFVPCAAHSLNLVVVDASKSSRQATAFFGIVNRLFVVFGASPARWGILKKHVSITLKPLSDTRWESHINALKPLRHEYEEVLAALDELHEYALQKKDRITASEARSLRSHLEEWPFIISTVVWHDALSHINKSSKILQSPNARIDVQLTEVESSLRFLKEYRKNRYASAVASAKQIADAADIVTEFKEERHRRRKRQFDYEGADEGGQRNAEERFRSEFFYALVDASHVAVSERFSQLKSLWDTFGFLVSDQDPEQRAASCRDFAKKISDVDGAELCVELNRYSGNYDLKDPLNSLNHIHTSELVELYPNLQIALRILLSIPTSVASAERSFSKLKLIKNYLRSTQSQTRLTALATISIEQKTARQLDYTDPLQEFVMVKKRRTPLGQ